MSSVATATANYRQYGNEFSGVIMFTEKLEEEEKLILCHVSGYVTVLVFCQSSQPKEDV